MNSRSGDPKESKKKTIDSILGFSLEGRGLAMDKQKEKSWPYQTHALINHDLEDEALRGEEGKNETGVRWKVKICYHWRLPRS